MFEFGKLAEELTVFADSDWAGCKETRKSSSAGVMMLEAEGHCKEQRRGRTVCSSIGSAGSKGSPKHDA